MIKNKMMLGCFAGILSLSSQAQAVVLANSVSLQNATATFSQTGFDAGESIDNSLSITSNNGWASLGQAETIVWETVQNLGSGSTAMYNFRLYQGVQGGSLAANLLLRNFRLSYTTTDRSTFADGLANGGDVSTRWAVIDDFTSLDDDMSQISLSSSISGEIAANLTGSVQVNQETGFYYDVTANIIANGITGFKLEVMNPPGLSNTNNFVLRELQVTSSVPEPSSLLIVMSGCGLLVFQRRKNS